MSDIDLLADSAEVTTLLDLIRLEQELATLLGRDVHVTTEVALPPKVGNEIQRDTIRL